MTHFAPQAKQAAKKPAKKPGGRRYSAPESIELTIEREIKATFRSVPRVPEGPEAPGARARAAGGRVSSMRVGLAATALLSVFVGGLTWFVEMLGPHPDFSQLSFGPPGLAPVWADPLPPHVRESMEQELRLAMMKLNIRESEANLARLSDNARALTASIASLATGMEDLRTDMGEARTEAAAELARVEDRLRDLAIAEVAEVAGFEVAAAAEPILLGDPALRGFEVAQAPEPILLGDPALRGFEVAESAEPTLLGDPALREAASLSGPRHAAAERSILQASEPAPPAVTGALAEDGSKATVQVTLGAPKPQAKRLRRIAGWHVHSVRDDLAIVDGHGTHYEVRAGELLPDGAGVVRAIKKKGEEWVVVTNRGVITELR